MRRAITTKYFGYTQRNSSRVKAIGRAREEYSDGTKHPELSHYQPYYSGLSADENHITAAKALAVKAGWHGLYVAGGLPDNSGNCYVCLEGNISPSMIAGHALDRHPLGIEGRDWFYVPEHGA